MTDANLLSLSPHSSATFSKFGASLVEEFLMQEMSTSISASLICGAMVRALSWRCNFFIAGNLIGRNRTCGLSDGERDFLSEG